MKVRVLRPALEDLARGGEFYNQQQEGVGDYFLDSLFSEIDHWCSMQEFTESNSDITAYWRAAFRMPSIIGSLKAKQSFFGCWIAAEPHDGSGSLSKKRSNRAASSAISLRSFRLKGMFHVKNVLKKGCKIPGSAIG